MKGFVTQGWLETPSPPGPAKKAGCLNSDDKHYSALVGWYLGQADILHDGPHDGQTTGFSGKGVNLIRALPDIAKETFNGIGTADIAMHDRWKSVKCQKMLFIFTEAADGFPDNASGMWLERPPD